MPGDSWKLAPGLNNVGSFQVSGRPFLTGACLAPISGASNSLVVRFPAVTKWFHIHPTQAMLDRTLRVAFSAEGLKGKGGSYIRLHQSSSFCRPMDMKLTEIYFMSEDSSTFTFDITAGLTNLGIGRTYTDQRDVNGVTEAGGPSWSGSIGVG